MDTFQEVSLRIKKARKKCGFTQEQLAALIGVSRLTITRWENNASCLSLGQLQQLAALLNSSLEDFLSVEGLTRNTQSQSAALDDAEFTLLTIFRELNSNGKQALLKQASLYSEVPSLRDK